MHNGFEVCAARLTNGLDHLANNIRVKYNKYSYILNGELSTGQCVGTTPVYVNSMPSQVYIKYGDLINLVMAPMIFA